MQRKVLFVDDEKIILDVLVALFQSHGYTPVCTTNGNQAVEIIKFEGIRVCFVDLRMPSIDGMELCRQIKQVEPLARVFALSAYVDAYGPEKLKQAGFDGQFTKPFKIKELMDTVDKCFEA